MNYLITVDARGVTFDVEYDRLEGVVQAFAGDDQQDIWELLCDSTQKEIERQIWMTNRFEAEAREAAEEDRADAIREQRMLA